MAKRVVRAGLLILPHHCSREKADSPACVDPKASGFVLSAASRIRIYWVMWSSETGLGIEETVVGYVIEVEGFGLYKVTLIREACLGSF